MRQHPDPDDYDDEDPEELGTPVYQGSGLSVRALTAEELRRFLDAHQGQPAELLGSGWAALDPPGHPLGVPRTPQAATPPVIPAEPPAGSLGSPGRSALAAYRRRRAEELAVWTRSLAWRAPLVAAAGLTVQVLADEAGLPDAGLLALAAAALVAWRLRFRPSEQARTWRRGAAGERRTARLLDRLTRDGFVVFHDLAVPDSPANVDHLAIGPSGISSSTASSGPEASTKAPTGWCGTTTIGLTAPWRRPVGKPRRSAAYSAPVRPRCCAFTAPTSTAAA
jgi:hypothetical protein